MSSRSVLIVDDSEGDQLLAKIIIEDFDSSIEILQAYDGQEALELIDSLAEPPTIILLDINMPRMNGLEFLKKYQAIETTKSLVAMVSSSEQKSDIETSMSYDFVKKYLPKPFDQDYLKELFEII